MCCCTNLHAVRAPKSSHFFYEFRYAIVVGKLKSDNINMGKTPALIRKQKNRRLKTAFMGWNFVVI